MSTFKIGDRVQHASPVLRNSYGEGVVTTALHESSEVRFDNGEEAGWWNWSLELVNPAPPIAPRGPRPLPIRQRVTLTAGKSLRAPARDMWSKVHTLTGPRLRDGERSWFV